MSVDTFLPVAHSVIPATLAKILTNKASLDLALALIENKRVAPTSLAELTSEDIQSSKLSVTVAGKLGIPFGSAEGSFSRHVFVQEHAKYVDIPDANGKVRWGIAIRWITNINVRNVSADLSNLSVISASAELGYVEASSKFQVIGMSSKRITKLLPADVELSIESYAVMKGALESIKAEIWSDQTTIKPTMLAIYSDIIDDSSSRYHESLLASWALSRIKEGRTLEYALSQDPIRTVTTQKTIESVYIDLLGSSDHDAKPDQSVIGRAKSALHGIVVKG